MDESEAIARLREGDIGGLEVLVSRYQVRATRAAYLITGDRATAEDVVQEAFVRAYERIAQFDPRRPFGPWFLRSVVNAAVKTAAREQRQLHDADRAAQDEIELDDLTVDPNPGPEELVEHVELSQSIGEALQRLSPPRRAAIVLRYYLDLTEPEIAGRLRWPLGTVKRRLHDARRHLRTLLTSTVTHHAGTDPRRKQARFGPRHAASGIEPGGKL
ncbi:MAG: sigma-70 family RNA polymerase sigma factor [Anaerolineae bacterium]|nr:sigma-70 family RNA polymerase sigma factor [Anaerolineae bacterium]